MDDGTLTTITRHFSSIFVTIGRPRAPRRTASSTAASGPVIDDWDFVNNGSYVARRTATARARASARSGTTSSSASPAARRRCSDRFDEPQRTTIPYGATPAPWTRTTATPTASRRWSRTTRRTAYDATERAFDHATKAKLGTAQYYAFAYAILVTGEPQYVGLYADAGGGHAMIVYAVDRRRPADRRPELPRRLPDDRVTYAAASGVLGPYKSSSNWRPTARGLTFQAIGYYAKTALVDWTSLGGRWEQFLDGTIG
jgi:hypothetical protein